MVRNSAEYIYLNGELENYKIRFQRAMYQDENRIRTKECKAVNRVMVVLWDGTVVPCCHVINKEITYGHIDDIWLIEKPGKDNQYCKHCFEVDEKMPVRFKL